MNAVVEPNLFRSMAAAPLDTDPSGGSMDEVLKRLGVLETVVIDVRLQLAAVTALLPTFATKADLLATKQELKEEISAINQKLSVLPHLASKAQLQEVRTELQAVRTEVQAVRTEVQAVRTEVRVEVQALRTDMQAVRTDMQAHVSGLIKWVVGMGLSSAGVAAAVATAISRLM